MCFRSSRVVHNDCRAPRRSGGAPLRLGRRDPDGQNHPCSPPIRRGSIAASTSKTAPTASSAVLPADQAGLHCGPSNRRLAAFVISCAPRRSGGAPLRHRTTGVIPARPARGCSPPIRRGSIAATRAGCRRPADRPVLPADQAGLHCGGRLAETAVAARGGAPRRSGGAPLRPNPRASTVGRREVLPADRRGSIAASTWTTTSRTTPRVLPADQAGLHCGRQPRIE